MAVLAEGKTRLAGDQTQLLEVVRASNRCSHRKRPQSTRGRGARIQIQTEQMRSSLLSAVSHDLRTPLASITGAASTLRSQGEKLLPETRQELLDSIADEAEGSAAW